MIFAVENRKGANFVFVVVNRIGRIEQQKKQQCTNDKVNVQTVWSKWRKSHIWQFTAVLISIKIAIKWNQYIHYMVSDREVHTCWSTHIHRRRTHTPTRIDSVLFRLRFDLFVCTALWHNRHFFPIPIWYGMVFDLTHLYDNIILCAERTVSLQKWHFFTHKSGWCVIVCVCVRFFFVRSLSHSYTIWHFHHVRVAISIVFRFIHTGLFRLNCCLKSFCFYCGFGFFSLYHTLGLNCF